MKLYIPTCTLNLSNILTTESISPVSFYAERGFGDKRFFPIESDTFNDIIILYDHFPTHNTKTRKIISKNEEHSHDTAPIILEIDMEIEPKPELSKILEKDRVKVYCCNSTIYFTPENCSIYFKNERDKKSAIIRLERSLEAKYFELYRENLKVYNEEHKNTTQHKDDKKCFEWTNAFCKEEKEKFPSLNPDEKKEHIAYDRYINQKKGCLVGYTMGARSSVTTNLAKLKKHTLAIHNGLSATPPPLDFDKQLDNLKDFIEAINYKTHKEKK